MYYTHLSSITCPQQSYNTKLFERDVNARVLAERKRNGKKSETRDQHDV